MARDAFKANPEGKSIDARIIWASMRRERRKDWPACPYYKVHYRTDADPDGRLWSLGPLPNRDHALGTFNSAYAKKEGIGPFTFDETSPFLADYHLVEQEMLNGRK